LRFTYNLELQERLRKAEAYTSLIEALYNVKIYANQFLQADLKGRELSNEITNSLTEISVKVEQIRKEMKTIDRRERLEGKHE
jgi:type II secretory pathway component PulM